MLDGWKPCLTFSKFAKLFVQLVILCNTPNIMQMFCLLCNILTAGVL